MNCRPPGGVGSEPTEEGGMSDANQTLTEAVKLLGNMKVDAFPHSRLAEKAGALVEEWRAYLRREYPYDKLPGACPICGGIESLPPLPGTNGRRCMKCCKM